MIFKFETSRVDCTGIFLRGTIISAHIFTGLYFIGSFTKAK